MHATNNTLLINLILIAAAAILATMFYRKVAPYLWGRRDGEPILAHIERVSREQQDKNAVQINLNMTPQKAFRVRLVNIGVMLGFLCLVSYSAPRIGHQFMGHAVLFFGAYVLVGQLACRLVKVVPAELLTGLNWNSRIDVRLYYVWLWPLNVAKAMQRKH